MFSFRTTSILKQEDLALTKGRVGVLCDHTAWDPESDEYIYEYFDKRGRLDKLFLFNVEDNSLSNEISSSSLSSLNALVIELQDLGCRYSPYPTLILNLFNSIVEDNLDLSVYIVDRINPGGRQVEGTLLRAGYRSSLGIEDIPHRHGLTIGEIAYMFHTKLNAKFPLHIISYKASPINKLFLPWSIPPTPYYSGLFTASFYCGQYLWKATNVSEGKGTSRPYEIFGAPFMEELSNYLQEHSLTGWNDNNSPISFENVMMRPCNFTPKFDKWAGLKCFGFQIILSPNSQYHSVMHNLKIMNFINKNCSGFSFIERSNLDGETIDYEKKNIELLLGDKDLIDYVKGYSDEDSIKEHLKIEEQKWIKKARKWLLYPEESLFRIK